MIHKPLLILGTRTLAEEVFDLASEVPGVTVAGFVENMDRSRAGQSLENLPINWIDDIGPLAATHQAICALATTKRKTFVEQVASMGFQFATLIHPSASLSRRSDIGPGSIISRHVAIATHTHLGSHVICNRAVSIGHHTTIGDFTTIQPGAHVAGACTTGSGVFIGMGALVLDHLTIGDHAVIGAGAVVTADVPPRVMVMGVPARIVKENVAGL